MKKSIYLLTALFAFSCVIYCFAERSSANRKLKKPVFIVSNEGSKLYDIKATDNYDSVFSYHMEMVQNEMGDVRVELHDVGTNGKELVDSTSYAGVFVEKFVFHRKGYEDTDTLYAWRVRLLYGMENEIMLNNVGTTLKIFGKNYGKSVSPHNYQRWCNGAKCIIKTLEVRQLCDLSIIYIIIYIIDIIIL